MSVKDDHTGRPLVHSLSSTIINADLHRDFRHIISLLTLVTAVNHNGYAILKNPDAGEYRGPFISSRPVPTDPVVPLNAVAAILVRSVEVIAVTVQASPNPEAVSSAQANINSAGIEPEPLQLTVALEDNDVPNAWDGFEFLALEGDDPEFEEMKKAAISSAPFAAIANPDIKDSYAFASCTAVCMVAGTGTSHWQHVTKGWKEMLDAVPVPRRDPIINHIATLTEYVREYQAASECGKTRLFHYATRYIIASCSKKMFRRIKHWSSLGFIYFLENANMDAMEKNFDRHYKISPSNRKDSALATTLSILQRKGDLTTIMGDDPYDIAPLISALDEQNKPGGLAGAAYSKNTARCFHRLLLAVLKGYGQALRKLEDAGDSGAAREGCAQPVWTFAFLLWRIAYSRILRDHLGTLANGQMLPMPKFHNVDISAYPWAVNKQIRAKGDQVKRDQDQAKGDQDQAKGDQDQAEGDEDQAADVEDEEVPVGIGGNSMLKEDKAYEQWLHLQVSHWAALDILSSMNGFLNVAPVPGVAVSLLALPHPNIVEDVPWKEMIRELFPRPISINDEQSLSMDAQAVINLTATLAKDCCTQKRVDSVVHGFKGDEETLKFNSTFHCEAVLTALFTCVDDPSVFPDDEDNRALKMLIKNSDPHAIAVSKLCCPVCWKLLEILRGDTERFQVRGYHSRVFRVALPPWLPEWALKKMVEHFKDVLICQIEVMAKKFTEKDKTHSRVNSGQSYMGLSVASDVSGRHSEAYDDPDKPTPLAS